jgi:tryptophan synthase alpha subunit
LDGVLVVELPPEEADELRTFTDPQGIDFITLTALTTDDRRLAKIVRTSFNLTRKYTCHNFLYSFMLNSRYNYS